MTTILPYQKMANSFQERMVEDALTGPWGRPNPAAPHYDRLTRPMIERRLKALEDENMTLRQINASQSSLIKAMEEWLYGPDDGV